MFKRISLVTAFVLLAACQQDEAKSLEGRWIDQAPKKAATHMGGINLGDIDLSVDIVAIGKNKVSVTENIRGHELQSDLTIKDGLLVDSFGEHHYKITKEGLVVADEGKLLVRQK